jgi:hypothetical protein
MLVRARGSGRKRGGEVVARRWQLPSPGPETNKETSMPKTLLLITILLPAAACTQAPGGDVNPRTEQALARTTAAAASDHGSIESVEYHGTGCEGSAKSSISPDGQADTSVFSDFLASAGPDEDPALTSRNCLQMLRINVPGGWSYSLESVDHRGFASLDKGVTATRKSVYIISGSAIQAPPAGRLKGELSADYQQSDISPEAPGEWSPCGGGQILWIATEIAVDTSRGGRGAAGQLFVDSIDTELQWRRCQ